MENFLQQLINGIALGSVYALVALGYTMVYGVLRLINFAHGDVYMLGAYYAYYASAKLSVEAHPSLGKVVLVFLISMLGCALTGMIIERLAYRPLRSAPKLTALITAIGVSMLLEFGGQAVFGPDPKPFPDLIPSKALYQSASGALRITNQQVLIIGVSLALMAILRHIVMKTRVGKAMRAISQDGPAASLMGVNTDRVIMFTFALGSALAAVAGILIALYQPTINPLMGVRSGLKAFVAAVLGGIGNIPGAVLGGLLMGLAETAVTTTKFSGFRDAIAFVLLILILLVRPSGLLGSVAREKV